MDDREERIRQRAHQMWELAGRPQGQHDAHWRLAMAEIDSEHETLAGPTKLSESAGAAELSASKKKAIRRRTETDGSDKALTDEGKLSRVAKGEEFEALHLAETTDLSPNQAKALLRKHGNDWAKIKDEAKRFKAEG